jgi:hypothetical protein
VLVGKLAMVELVGGFGYNTADASFRGPCRTPWNPDFFHWRFVKRSGGCYECRIGSVLGWAEKPEDPSFSHRPTVGCRECALLMDESAGTVRSRYAGPSIRSGRSAAGRTIAAWC